MKKWPWMGKDGKVHFEEWMSDNRTKTVVPPSKPSTGEDVISSVPGAEGGSDQDRAKQEVELEPIVLDLRKDAMGNIRTVRVPLSQANEETRRAYSARHGKGDQSTSVPAGEQTSATEALDEQMGALAIKDDPIPEK